MFLHILCAHENLNLFDNGIPSSVSFIALFRFLPLCWHDKLFWESFISIKIYTAVDAKKKCN